MWGDYVYNRYIPDESGRYVRKTENCCRQQPTCDTEPPGQSCTEPLREPPSCARTCEHKDGCGTRRLFSRCPDTGDLLILAILLLLFIDGEEEDTLSVLLTFAAFILL